MLKLIVVSMKLIKNIIFSLLPLIVFLVLLEGIARLAGSPKTNSPSEELQNIYNQKAIEGVKKNLPTSMQLNRYGFRGRELNFKVDTSKTYTIVILGGSVATGAWAAQLENTPAAYLEKNLKDFIRNKYNKDLVVYSLAESGSDIEDEAFWLLKLGLALKPNLVLSITGFNNMSNATNDSWEKSSGGRAFQRAMLLFKPNEVNEGVAVNFQRLSRSFYLLLVNKSRLMTWLDYLLFAEKQAQEAKNKIENAIEAEQTLIKKRIDLVSNLPKPDSMPILQAQRFKQTAIQINKICKANNISYLVILQPFRDCGKILMQNLPSDGSKDNRNQFIYRTLIKEWNSSPIVSMPYLETSEIMSDALQEEKLFGDDCHLWDNGFVLFNQTIADWLKKSL